MEKSYFELRNLTAHSRTWATVDLGNLKHNLSQIRLALPDKTKVMAVVKADGYGHGDIRVARVLLENGVDFLAVSNIDEALSLRNSDELLGFSFEVLILGYTPLKFAKILSDNDIQQTLISLEYAKALQRICVKSDIKLRAHIKVDTGMSRLGVSDTSFEDVVAMYNLEGIEIAGIFTHLSSADGLDDGSIEFTKLQQDRFDVLIKKISKEDASIKIGKVHLQNSAGVITITNAYDYARIGLMLYGIAPMQSDRIELKPVMSLYSEVAMVKEIDKDVAISYGRHFVADKPMKVATIPVGYADGYPRGLSKKGRVLINGKFANILGNVCMDQIIVDVTEIDVKMGDVVTLIGSDGGNSIHIDDVAKLVGTISYELVCLVGKRVPREVVNL